MEAGRLRLPLAFTGVSNSVRDRTSPAGYKLSVVPFKDGNPVANSENNTAAIEVINNADNSACPENCFRPVGMAFDKKGRLFFSSDATGEIYVVIRNQELSSTDGSATANSPSTPGLASSAFKNSIQPFLRIFSVALLIFITIVE
jgi:hypothetical protein